jgi:hypothetical protein
VQHFILTRFNIASPGRESTIRNSPGWLERRFELFERYCLPSMAAQDSPDFTWLIYFDKDTPAQFRQRIDAARAVVPFEPRYVGLFDIGIAVDDVRERLDPVQPRVVTTRLDNDDAVSRDFLSRVRHHAGRLSDGSVINFTRGVALRKGRLYAASDTSNPFTSLVERADGVQTIWSAKHRDLERLWNLVQVDDAWCWLQVVHGENVANRIKGARLSDAEVLANFAINPETPIEPTGGTALLADRLLTYPARCFREGAIALARGVRNLIRGS